MVNAVAIERLFGGMPLISPTDHWWESGVTFNSASYHVAPTPENAHVLHALLGTDDWTRFPDGVVALHYRARPKEDPGFVWTRSFVGLAVYTPDLKLLKRFDSPVLSPSDDPHGVDYLGVEDPRITFLEGWYYMVYCGVAPTADENDPRESWIGSVCMARSQDLVHWQKMGATPGDSDAFADARTDIGDPRQRVSNKDGVLFPDRINGHVYLLHRPMRGDVDDFTTHIASSDAVGGPYTDHGFVNDAMPGEGAGYEASWVGAGTVPIRIGEGRYVAIGHTGNYLPGKKRKYVLDAFLYDFNHFDPNRPETLIAARLDDFMRPETDFEVKGPYPDSVANVVFACGSYVHDGWLYVVYGGGDTFILAARFRFDEFVRALEAVERR